MDNSGFIPLSRKFFKHPFWTKERTFSLAEAWIDIVQTARFEVAPEKVLVNMNVLTINRGELRGSLRFLASRWGWSKDKVSRFLKLLESETMIRRETRQGESIVIVLNYNKFNPAEGRICDTGETENETPVRHPHDNCETPSRQTKESKEGKEREEVYGEIIDFFNETCVSLPSVKLTPKRKGNIRARIREHSLPEVYEMIENAAASSFLAGQNRRDWQATFDWLFRPNNFVKVLEGNYKDKNHSEQDFDPDDTRSQPGMEAFNEKF